MIKEDHGLETSVLGLRFKVRDKHFRRGDLKLKCTATIATIYWKSNEESVQGVRAQSALVSESRSSRESKKASSGNNVFLKILFCAIPGDRLSRTPSLSGTLDASLGPGEVG